MSVNATLDVISMSNWRGDQISAFFFRKIIAVHDSFARLNFYQLLCISPIFKTLVLRSLFPFHSICQFFCHVFFISLSVTPLLYTQPLNRIIGIISKNSTTLSSKNIVEVMHQEYPRMQVELNSFSSKTITETTTETTTTILKLYVQDSLLRELRELQIPRLIKS